MMALIFQYPGFLPLAIIAGPAVFVLIAYGIRSSRKDAAAMGTRDRLRRRPYVVALCYGLAACLLGLALARPAWKREPIEVERGGRDVLFLLDVSRSMLAADLSPDRLTYAKRAIFDCVDSLQGHRVGLVTFAGSPTISCPLTTDYAFFREMLEEASPENVSQGGTRIGDALRKSVDKLLSEERAGLQDIVLISDGGDQESHPAKAAAELEGYGVFLITIGIGDEVSGARIPARNPDGSNSESFTIHDGQEVWSQLDAAPLEAIADACEAGAFINAGTRSMALGDLYRDLVRHLRSQGEGNPETLMRWRDEFLKFLMGALGFVFVGMVVRVLGSRPPVLVILIGGVMIGLHPAAGIAQEEEYEDEETMVDLPNIPEDAREAYNLGCELYGEEDYDGARAAFEGAIDQTEDAALRKRAWYNLGSSQFAQGDGMAAADPVAGLEYYLGASRAFRAALDHEPDWEQAAWNRELSLVRAQLTQDAMERQQEQQQEQEEGDPSEQESPEGESEEFDEEDYEGEWEESEESGDSQPSDQSSSQMAMDLESQEVPPPMLDPEDIFQEESENNESRDKKSGKKYQPVEKDW